jgi:hypothetical protein
VQLKEKKHWCSKHLIVSNPIVWPDIEFSNPDIWPDIESLSSYLVCGIELRYADFVCLAFPLYWLTPVCNGSTIPLIILSWFCGIVVKSAPSS